MSQQVERGEIRVPSDYRDAVDGAALAERRERRFVEVEGRAPDQMLLGILTSRVPAPPEEAAGLLRGEAVPSAILTAKGKVISDLRLLRQGEGRFLLDLPAAGLEGTLENFERFLPPRMARARERKGELTLLSLVGPRGPGVLTRAVPEVGDALEESLPREGRFVALETEAFGRLWILSSGELAAPTLDLLLAADRAPALRERLQEEGARPLGQEALRTLRMEAGTPAYGVDMDRDTLLVETGIHETVMDDTKGCFTGQEFVVRVRDRGRVARHLRWIFLGDVPAPESGTEFYDAQGGKAVGRITSACPSPRFGETLAMGYVHRSVEPGGRVRLGSPEGTEGLVRELGDR